jgi:Zn-dependent protease/predicted transcriptional regulator
MLWSITIGRIAGTAIRIHVTFLLFLFWIAVSSYTSGGIEAARSSVVLIILVFACVVAHEFGHILVARKFGVKTREITLWPIGGVANIERIPDDPKQELLIAVAGPSVNVIIAGILMLVWGVTIRELSTINFEKASLVLQLALINISLVLFNLIPAFPMDGGRVFRALLSMRLGPQRAIEIAARTAQVLVFVFVAAGLFLNPMLIFIGLFIYIAANFELQSSAFHRLADGLNVSDAMERQVKTFPMTAPLSEVVDALIASSQPAFPVLNGADAVIGLLDRDDLVRGLINHSRETPVSAAMREPATVKSSDSLSDAIANMAQNGLKVQIVLDRNGKVVGLLTLENLAEMMMIRNANPQWDFHNHKRREHARDGTSRHR